MDWEVPSHADSGPAGMVQPAAVPTGSGGAAAGQEFLPARPAATAADFAEDQDELTSAPDPAPSFQPDAAGQPDAADRQDASDQPDAGVDAADQPGAGAGQDRSWRSMFRQVSPDPAGQDPAGHRQAGHSATRPRPGRPHLPRPQLASLPLVSRPLVNPRLAADPRLRIWTTRIAITAVLYFGFMLWHGWRLGLTIAALYAAADIVFRSKTTAIVPPSIRVTSAQRSTMRRLKVLQPAGYLALNACTIPGKQPGTRSIIDHVVIGPAGVFVLNSEKWDRRLPVRIIGGRLYHGPVNQEERLKHSQWEAHQAATLISASIGHPVKVRPAMIIYGPKVPWVVGKLQGVDVFDGGRVGTFFRRQSKATARHHLDASQIADLYAAAAQALPPMP